MASGERKSKKDRVVHTRIPVALEREIKRLAETLRVPVSNLVRQILEDSVQFVGSVGSRVGEISREVQRDREHLGERWTRYRGLFQRLAAPPSRRSSAVYGWQPLIVHDPTRCEACGKNLAAGAGAFVGLSDDPTVRQFRCESCLPKLETSDEKPEKGGKGAEP